MMWAIAFIFFLLLVAFIAFFVDVQHKNRPYSSRRHKSSRTENEKMQEKVDEDYDDFFKEYDDFFDEQDDQYNNKK